ncbi:major facilitator superfamily transporter [Fusarium acutatum]|uniref:Major facilitator superfamily transporter n=1 Tax=Fusarium acutatum TaxID=78861 RepID=A0A8H4JLS9_9HYPO|nr:major facilitator superfamily transporter [Fusarium acutatum]
MAQEIRTVAIVGCGVIGMGWAVLFLSRGLKVIISDPAEGAENVLKAYFEQSRSYLEGFGDYDKLISNYEFVHDIIPRLAEADFIQENGPERLELKRGLIATLDKHARRGVVIASSSSGLPSSEFIQQCNQDSTRVLIGHPFNPPHLIPLVEVVPHPGTSSKSVNTTLNFYRSVGKRPILLHHEVPGFVSNRLQAAINNEAYSLISRGIVSAEDLDAAVTSGPGLRWALTGPIATNALGGGGGPEGFSQRMERLGPAIRGWEDDILKHRFDWSEQRMLALQESVNKSLGAVNWDSKPMMDTDTEQARAEKPNHEQPKPNTDFPDGGLKAWSTVLGAFCGLFVGVFQAYYEANQLQDLSPSTVSWIPALSMFMMFITVGVDSDFFHVPYAYATTQAPVVGRAFDIFGPRYLLLAGTLLHVFGLMMASISSEYYQFILSQAICSPLGAAMVLYPSFSCVTTWFRQKRALALGITASGSSLGGTILPIVVNRLIPRIGFGWTMRVCAFLLFALLLVTNLTVRSRVAPQPKDTGIIAYLRPFTSLSFVITSLAGFFYSMGMFIPITFMVTYGEHVGLSNSMAGYLVSIFNASSGIGRILPGYIADKVGSFNVSIAAATLSTLFMLALWLPGHSHESAIAFAALFGFSSGTYTAISPALIAHISELEEIGTRSGTMYAFMSVAALTGSPIGGALISSADGSYWKLQVFAGCMLGAGTAFYIAARLYLSKGRFWEKV